MDINASWMIVKASNIKPGKSNKIALGIYELKDISKEINDVFQKILDENFDIAINRGAEGVRSKIK